MAVKAKKYWGQHFLTDKNIAAKIVRSLHAKELSKVLEIGPGMGILTKLLLEIDTFETSVVEIDSESVEYLKNNYPDIVKNIIEGDFLKLDLLSYSKVPFAIIGNFPYNISSQIFFKVLENRDLVEEVVGMLQKEVAERLCAGPGSKTYGILSVLLQAWYSTEYLFTVSENVFSPPPKVKSAVIRLVRNKVNRLECDEKLFVQVVKQGFSQRRKMLSNSLKSFFSQVNSVNHALLTKRPEQLGVSEFIEVTKYIEKHRVK